MSPEQILFSMITGDRDHLPEEPAHGSVTAFGEGNIVSDDLYAEVAFGVRGCSQDDDGEVQALLLWQPTREEARHAAFLLNRYADARDYDLDELNDDLGQAS